MHPDPTQPVVDLLDDIIHYIGEDKFRKIYKLKYNVPAPTEIYGNYDPVFTKFLVNVLMEHLFVSEQVQEFKTRWEEYRKQTGYHD